MGFRNEQLGLVQVYLYVRSAVLDPDRIGAELGVEATRTLPKYQPGMDSEGVSKIRRHTWCLERPSVRPDSLETLSDELDLLLAPLEPAKVERLRLADPDVTFDLIVDLWNHPDVASPYRPIRSASLKRIAALVDWLLIQPYHGLPKEDS